MRKILLSFAAFIMVLGCVSAQKVSWGVKADLNLSTFVGSDAEGSNNKVGYAFGVLIDFPMNKIASFVPELKYTNIGAKGEVEQGTSATMNMNYLALPLMFRFHFNPNVSFEIGPQFAYLITAKAEIQSVSVDITDQFQRFDAGVATGLVVEFNKVFLTGRYNYSLTQFIEDQNAYHSVVSLGLGIKF